MERIDLTKVIKDATAIFCQNRIGDKPPISVTVPAIVTDIPWPDRKLQELVKLFLYETLLTNDPDAEVTVSLRRRSSSKISVSLSECNLHTGSICASQAEV